MRVPEKIRRQVLTRDQRRCVRCSQYAVIPQVHHRQPRGMGGTSRKASFDLSNLICVCHLCHGYIERHRAAAYAMGWLVRSPIEPVNVRLKYRGQWALLDNVGGIISGGDPA